MHVTAQLFQALFMRHTKVLFFINDQQTKVFETDAFGQQRMGADHDINRAMC